MWKRHFLTSCAGGMTVDTVIPVTWQKQQGYGAGLTVTGLEGGHSGSEIDKEHANANILMGRVLKYLSDRMELAVVSLAGGLKDNAIPRECEAEIVIPEEKKAELSDYITELEKIFKKEYAVSDPAVCIEIKENGTGEYDVLSYSSMTKVIFYLRNVPNGVQHMSMVMPGLVETSLNTGIMKLTTDRIELTASVRSSVSTRKEELKDKLEYLANF